VWCTVGGRIPAATALASATRTVAEVAASPFRAQAGSRGFCAWRKCLFPVVAGDSLDGLDANAKCIGGAYKYTTNNPNNTVGSVSLIE
jgi:hypothetical protein